MPTNCGSQVPASVRNPPKGCEAIVHPDLVGWREYRTTPFWPSRNAGARAHLGGKRLLSRPGREVGADLDVVDVG